MKKLLLSLVGFLGLIASHSQVVINDLNSPYSQDFNTLANVNTSSSVPTGWALLETGNNANNTYQADNGNLNSGNTYSYGAANDAERAFGGIQSASLIPTIGVQFVNNSGSTITSIKINYTGEMWRLGTADANNDRLDFQYSTDAVSLSQGTYIDVNTLDFTSPVAVGVGPKDGNVAQNRTVIPAVEIQGLNIPNGATFWIRWTDFNVTSADDGLAIDDFTIAFAGNNNPPCVEPTSQANNLNLVPTPTTVAGSFTAADPAADQYLVVQSLSNQLGADPVDATSYKLGDAIGNGKVVAVGSSTNFNATGLLPNTQYFYFVFAFNSENCGGGPNYNSNAPLSLSTTTLPLPACVSPINAPTNLNLVAGNNFISGSFTAAQDANRYLVVRSLNNNLGFIPQNSTTYTAGQVIGQDVVVSYGTSVNFIAQGLQSNTQYYFYVFAANGDCSGEPFYNLVSLNGNANTSQNANGIPPGYYDPAIGLTGQPLKTALKNIIGNGYTQLSYTPGLWLAYQYTDMHKDDNNVNDIIWDIYSDNPNGPEPYTYTYGVNQCGTYQNEGDCYNREHSTPQSWFKNGTYPMFSDLHHIFPTDGKVNGLRSNYPYGEVQNIVNVNGFQNPSQNGSKLGTGTNFGYNGTVFEPIDAYKGDVARASLYMATRYEDGIITDNWSANGSANELFLSLADEPDPAKRRLQIYDAWQVKTLIKWHLQDPVSQKEIDRNNAIYYQQVNDGGLKSQHNRNPFVDHPEFVMAIWSATGLLPVTVMEFKGTSNGREVLLNWTATNETNFKQYNVQQSIDGVNFYTVGQVKGTNASKYTFTVKELPAAKTVYYRLQLVNSDNSYEYSKVVAVKLNNIATAAIVYPNPAHDKVTVKFERNLTESSSLSIMDLAGKVVLQQKIQAGQQVVNINVNALPAGRYFIKVMNSQETINQSLMIVK